MPSPPPRGLEGWVVASRPLWGLLGLSALYYIVTSLVVVVNGLVWLPTMPSSYYAVEKVMYWPAQPYFDAAYALLGRIDMPYAAYAALTRAPFILIFGFLLALAVKRLLRRSR